MMLLINMPYSVSYTKRYMAYSSTALTNDLKYFTLTHKKFLHNGRRSSGAKPEFNAIINDSIILNFIKLLILPLEF